MSVQLYSDVSDVGDDQLKRASPVPGRELKGKAAEHGVRGKTAEGIRQFTVLLNAMGALLREKWHWGTKSGTQRQRRDLLRAERLT